MRFWVSWYQPTEDMRPLTAPPNESIRGWWCSGETCDEPPQFTLCAVVDALDEDAARAGVLKDWPEASTWRFVLEVASDYLPNDRFPASDWMIDRLATPREVAP